MTPKQIIASEFMGLTLSTDERVRDLIASLLEELPDTIVRDALRYRFLRKQLTYITTDEDGRLFGFGANVCVPDGEEASTAMDLMIDEDMNYE